MLVALLLASLLTVEKLAIEKESVTNNQPLLPLSSESETESIAAVQPNGDVEHIMLSKAQYEELKAGGTIKLGPNVRLRAKVVPK